MYRWQRATEESTYLFLIVFDLADLSHPFVGCNLVKGLTYQ